MTIAVGQLRVHDGDLADNANLCRCALEDAAAAGAELLVLPECALTGYLFADRAAAAAAAIDACDPELRQLHELATRAGTTVVVGFLERRARRCTTPPRCWVPTVARPSRARRTSRCSPPTGS